MIPELYIDSKPENKLSFMVEGKDAVLRQLSASMSLQSTCMVNNPVIKA